MPILNTSRPSLKVTKPRNNHQGRTFYDKRYNTTLWKQTRLQVLCANPICVHCEKAYANEVDHIIPVKEGADFYDITNLQALCKSCHSKKSRKERD